MNDAPNIPRMWAYKGEAITCVNGHVVCEMACDVHIGDARSGDHFTNWKQTQPDRSTPVTEIRCTECRGVWIRGNLDAGYQFHFNEGWR